MLSKLKSCGLLGIDAYIVEVETFISNGIPAFEIVGLGDAAVKESKERVRAAIKNVQRDFPIRRITINLAPANVKKEGSIFDLPIALGILLSTLQIKNDNIEKYVFIGELSLDGRIKPVNGVLPMAICAKNSGIQNIVVPRENVDEAAVIRNLNVLTADSISEVADHLNGIKKIEKHIVDIDRIFKDSCDSSLDFYDVKGQENAKRALEVAASGGHNCIMIGPPGSGKTMIAKRLHTILPYMTLDEALEVTKIYSIAGMLKTNTSLISSRPFRSPHHTISDIGLIGGGKYPRPGEVSLAHYGVLFLDEVPEFSKTALEVLRQPIEDGEVTISRLNASYTYPSMITLVCTANPCKCGYYMDYTRECICTQKQIRQYMSKLSGPLMDRIDIHIEVATVKYKCLEKEENGEDSNTIRKRVNNTRKIQIDRYKDIKIYSNSQLLPGMIKKYCALDRKGRKLLKNAFENLGLSARAHDRILKVSRTIADMEQCENIKEDHIAEAVQYRSLDRKFWTGQF